MFCASIVTSHPLTTVRKKINVKMLLLILLSQLARECMLIIPFPTDDKNEMLVDVLSPVAGI